MDLKIFIVKENKHPIFKFYSVLSTFLAQKSIFIVVCMLKLLK